MAQKYVQWDANKQIFLFYSDDVHETIPQEAVPVKDDDWQDCLRSQPLKKYKIVNGQFVIAPESDYLPLLIQGKKQVLDRVCASNLDQGFTSTATGTGYKYSYTIEDRSNFNAQIALLNLDPTITSIDWPTLNGGVVKHTRDQFIQLFKDAQGFNLSCISKCSELKAKANQVTAVSQLDAIQ